MANHQPDDHGTDKFMKTSILVFTSGIDQYAASELNDSSVMTHWVKRRA